METSTLIADTHVHYYPVYNAGQFWAHTLSNLGRVASRAGLSGEIIQAIYLTERHDCHAFADWASGAPVGLPDGAEVHPTSEPWCLSVQLSEAHTIQVLAGRQIATKERLEVLALCTCATFEDGADLEASVAAAESVGAVTVIPWAPGKWLGARGKRVADQVEKWGQKILLGDSATRPVGWPEPALMAQHRSAGGKVLAGSDPYPVAGEESRPGTYGMAWTGIDQEKPMSQICRDALRAEAQVVGARKAPLGWALSMWRNR